MAKFWAALLSSLLICLVGAYMDYTPVDLRETGILYPSMFRLFLSGWIILFPIYLVLGIPLSMMIDGILLRFFEGAPNWILPWMTPVTYLLGGVAAGWLFSLFTGVGAWDAYKWPFMMGAIIFWGFQEAFKLLGKRMGSSSDRHRRSK